MTLQSYFSGAHFSISTALHCRLRVHLKLVAFSPQQKKKKKRRAITCGRLPKRTGGRKVFLDAPGTERFHFCCSRFSGYFNSSSRKLFKIFFFPPFCRKAQIVICQLSLCMRMQQSLLRTAEYCGESISRERKELRGSAEMLAAHFRIL